MTDLPDVHSTCQMANATPQRIQYDAHPEYTMGIANALSPFDVSQRLKKSGFAYEKRRVGPAFFFLQAAFDAEPDDRFDHAQRGRAVIRESSNSSPHNVIVATQV